MEPRDGRGDSHSRFAHVPGPVRPRRSRPGVGVASMSVLTFSLTAYLHGAFPTVDLAVRTAQ